MKARVVYGPPGYYEIEIKTAWYAPWRTAYNGMFPARFISKKEAEKVCRQIRNK